MTSLKSIFTCATLIVAHLLVGCAPTSVQTLEEYNGLLPRPTKIVVYNFAVSPDEVKLDSGVVGKVENMMKSTPRTAEERAIGASASEAFAKSIVSKLQDDGLPAVRSVDTSGEGTILEIQGQFISVNEGNMAEREVIGFGMGATEVKSYIQVYEITSERRVLVAKYETDAKSGYKPGLAVTLGAGAVAGKIATSAVVGGTMAVVSEAFTSTVNADAKRTAEDLAKRIKQMYSQQGW